MRPASLPAIPIIGQGSRVRRRLFLLPALVLAFAGHVGDDLLELRAAQDLVADAVGRLARRAEHGVALALDATEERIGETADEHVVVRHRLAFGLGLRFFLREELLQIDRVAGAQRHVAVVREKLRDAAHLARPFPRAENGVHQVALGGDLLLRPDEDLRHEQDRFVGLTLHVEERADEDVAFGLLVRTRRRLEERRRALQEERGRIAGEQRLAKIGGVGGFGARRQRVEPAAAHRLQDPQPEIVREAHLRQVQALGQVVQREEVDEGEVALDVDDRPSRVGVTNRLRPLFVDFDVLEKPLVENVEDRVRLVRDELATFHECALSGYLMLSGK